MSQNRFFIIGAQRSGSTYLYTVLDEHPEICLAKPLWPEPKYFLNDDEYSKGIIFYEKKYFQPNSHTKVFGEKSTSYFELEHVAQRIKKHYPESKIIIILRNPVTRALSNYFYSVKNGFENRKLTEVFINKKPAPRNPENVSVSPFNYLSRGEYLHYIRNYLQYFELHKVLVLIMEKTLGAKKEIQKVYRFLNVDPYFTPSSILEKINSTKINLSKIDNVVTVKLKEHFKPHIASLESFLEINLDIWRS
jgi:hypothetical protein